MADSTQPNVASLPAATGNGYLTVVVPPQAGCTTPALSNVEAQREFAFGDDPAFSYPFGLVRFQLNCAGPVTVELIVHHGASLAGSLTTYRKYGHVAPNFAGPQTFYTLPSTPPSNVTFGTSTIGRNPVLTVMFTLQDGLLGDDGPAGDGMIVDPGGPALAAAAATPALSAWSLAALVLLLSAIGWLAVRRHRLLKD